MPPPPHTRSTTRLDQPPFAMPRSAPSSGLATFVEAAAPGAQEASGSDIERFESTGTQSGAARRHHGHPRVAAAQCWDPPADTDRRAAPTLDPPRPCPKSGHLQRAPGIVEGTPACTARLDGQ